MRKNQNLTEKVTVKLMDSEKKLLDQEASDKHLTRSELMRQKLFLQNTPDPAVEREIYRRLMVIGNDVSHALSQVRTKDKMTRSELLDIFTSLQKELYETWQML